MNIFLALAFVSALIAFIEEVALDKGDKLFWSVAGWLILTLVFYLASLLFPVKVGTHRQNNP